MKTIVLHIDEASENAEIMDFLHSLDSDEVKERDYYGAILNMFEGDPDQIKMYGENTLFIDFIIDSVRYVIYLCELESIEFCLSNFFKENFKEKFHYDIEQQNWDAFHKSHNAIAYRGGSGYLYTFYTFKNLQTWKLNSVTQAL